MSTIESLIKMMMSSLDDDNRSTRSYVCKLFLLILGLYGKKLDKDQLHKLYPEFIKRLDDQSEEIRFEIIKVFNIYIESLNQDYDIILYQAHLQTIYENILLYLDDPNLEIQLKIFSKILI
jgi:dynein assembly factor 5, axonemal